MSNNRSTRARQQHRAMIARTKPPCALCGEPIDYTLGFVAGQHGSRCTKRECQGCTPDPMRYEVDHVVPLARGGADSLSNKQATHRKCNSQKRARAESPVVKRSGSLA